MAQIKLAEMFPDELMVGMELRDKVRSKEKTENRAHTGRVFPTLMSSSAKDSATSRVRIAAISQKDPSNRRRLSGERVRQGAHPRAAAHQGPVPQLRVPAR
jgi:hypothetical protein